MRYVKNNDVWKTSIQYTYLNGTWKRVRDVSGVIENSWKSTIPPIGTFIDGGYVTGVIDTVASGGERYIVLVAPKQYQIIGIWSANRQYYYGSNAISKWDGLANTTVLANANYPAANYCATLVINGGYNDWYLPAIDELELVHRNLKPTTLVNDTRESINYPGQINGYNPSSDPIGAGYVNGLTNPVDNDDCPNNLFRVLLTGAPLQTPVGIFQDGQSESYWPGRFPLSGQNVVAYWSSTYYEPTRSVYRLLVHTHTDSCAARRSGCQKVDGFTLTDMPRFIRPVRRLII